MKKNMLFLFLFFFFLFLSFTFLFSYFFFVNHRFASLVIFINSFGFGTKQQTNYKRNVKKKKNNNRPNDQPNNLIEMNDIFHIANEKKETKINTNE